MLSGIYQVSLISFWNTSISVTCGLIELAGRGGVGRSSLRRKDYQGICCVGGVGEEKGRGPHRMSREENLSQGNENEEATSLENTPVP